MISCLLFRMTTAKTGPPLKGGKKISAGKFFRFRERPFSEGRPNVFDRFTSPESVSIPLNPCPANPGYALPLQTV